MALVRVVISSSLYLSKGSRKIVRFVNIDPILAAGMTREQLEWNLYSRLGQSELYFVIVPESMSDELVPVGPATLRITNDTNPQLSYLLPGDPAIETVEDRLDRLEKRLKELEACLSS